MVELIAERETLYRKICSLPDNAIASVMSIIDGMTIDGAGDYEPDDLTVYEDMDPAEEDALYRSLARVEAVWEDE